MADQELKDGAGQSAQGFLRERRQEQRVSFTGEVTNYSEPSAAPWKAFDLSEGGIFVTGGEVLPVGTEVELGFNLPGYGLEVVTTARVSWINAEGQSGYNPRKPSGLGLQFIELDPEYDRVVKQYMAGRRSSVPKEEIESLLDEALADFGDDPGKDEGKPAAAAAPASPAHAGAAATPAPAAAAAAAPAAAGPKKSFAAVDQELDDLLGAPAPAVKSAPAAKPTQAAAGQPAPGGAPRAQAAAPRAAAPVAAGQPVRAQAPVAGARPQAAATQTARPQTAVAGQKPQAAGQPVRAPAPAAARPPAAAPQATRAPAPAAARAPAPAARAPAPAGTGTKPAAQAARPPAAARPAAPAPAAAGHAPAAAAPAAAAPAPAAAAPGHVAAAPGHVAAAPAPAASAPGHVAAAPAPAASAPAPVAAAPAPAAAAPAPVASAPAPVASAPAPVASAPAPVAAAPATAVAPSAAESRIHPQAPTETSAADGSAASNEQPLETLDLAAAAAHLEAPAETLGAEEHKPAESPAPMRPSAFAAAAAKPVPAASASGAVEHEVRAGVSAAPAPASAEARAPAFGTPARPELELEDAVAGLQPAGAAAQAAKSPAPKPAIVAPKADPSLDPFKDEESEKRDSEETPENQELIHNGEILGSFQILKWLGSGGMGDVYLAEHTQLGRRVAIKRLRSEFAKNRLGLKRFFDEARSVNKIRHENIVEITDFVANDAHTYCVMEYLEGMTLADLQTRLLDPTAKAHSMPLDQVLHIAIQICSALEAVHSAGIIHRDLKPQNIMLVNHRGDPNFVKLLDFGVAKLKGPEDGGRIKNGSGQSTGSMMLGTPGYMSPEQLLGNPIDHRADIYALGVILYQMTTGTNPFVADTWGQAVVKHATAIPPRPSEATTQGGSIPEALETLTLQCLEKDPARRPATVGQVGGRLRAIAEGRLDVSDDEAPPKKRSSGGGLRIVIAAMVLAVLGGAGFAATRVPAVQSFLAQQGISLGTRGEGAARSSVSPAAGPRPELAAATAGAPAPAAPAIPSPSAPAPAVAPESAAREAAAPAAAHPEPKPEVPLEPLGAEKGRPAAAREAPRAAAARPADTRPAATEPAKPAEKPPVAEARPAPAPKPVEAPVEKPKPAPVEPAAAPAAPAAAAGEAPSEADAQYEEGKNLLKANKALLAVQAFQRCLAIKADHAKALRLMGQAYIMLGREDQAVAAFEKFLQLAPNHKDAPSLRKMIEEYRSR